jgi:hypothetical protein
MTIEVEAEAKVKAGVEAEVVITPAAIRRERGYKGC